jgi:hypothetical protein
LSKCKICRKETSEKSEYCELHTKAYENVKKGYDIWRKALDIDWNDYLKEILKNPVTGNSVKEVTQRLLPKE